jgi:hypothetical protein
MRKRYLGGFEGVVVRIKTANVMREPRREYRTSLMRNRVFRSSVLAQTIVTTKSGAVKIWMATSQRFQSRADDDGSWGGSSTLSRELCLDGTGSE